VTFHIIVIVRIHTVDTDMCAVATG